MLLLIRMLHLFYTGTDTKWTGAGFAWRSLAAGVTMGSAWAASEAEWAWAWVCEADSAGVSGKLMSTRIYRRLACETGAIRNLAWVP